MKKAYWKKTLILFLLFFIVDNAIAQAENDLEERITALEKEVESIKGILSELNRNVDNNSPKKTGNSEEVGKTTEQLPITAKLSSLSYTESNASNNYANHYSDWISFTFLFTNNLEKTIRAAKGTIAFMDIFGEEWWTIGLTLNDPIKPGETIEWSGQIDYNGFINSHKIAIKTDPADVMLRYDVVQIIFEDGTKQHFE